MHDSGGARAPPDIGKETEMSKQIENSASQAEPTTALVKYVPTVLNRAEGSVGSFRKAVDMAVYAFASVAFCAIAIALGSALVGEGDASERTLLLNLYTFAFGFAACCLAKAIRIVRSAFGRRSE